jgi:hypothetical protein
VNDVGSTAGNQLIQSAVAVGNQLSELHESQGSDCAEADDDVLTNEELAKAICSLISGKCSTFPKDKDCTSATKSVDSCFSKDFNDAAKDAGITNKKEALSFVANAIQETGCFEFDSESGGDAKTEYDYNGDKTDTSCASSCTCSSAGDCDQDHSDCSSKCKNHYYGRGYLQLTWHANYEKAEDESDFGLSGLVNDPSIAATKAWASAAWYWKCRVQRASCTGWPRSLVQTSASHKFSASTFYINGALECPYKVEVKDDAYVCQGTSNGVKTKAHKEHAYCRMYYFKTMYEAVTTSTVTVDNCCFSVTDYNDFAPASHCS